MPSFIEPSSDQTVGSAGATTAAAAGVDEHENSTTPGTGDGQEAQLLTPSSTSSTNKFNQGLLEEHQRANGLLKKEENLLQVKKSPTFPQGPVWRAQIPNMCTCVVILCGCCLMIKPTPLPLGLALLVALVAVVADMMDGLLARYLDACSQFGAAFDQLADLACFGISIGVYFVQHLARVGKDPEGLLLPMAGYIYVVCACARIARELVVHKIAKPLFFVGIPTNLAGPLVISMLIVDESMASLPVGVIATTMVALSWLMVMPIEIPKDLGTGVLGTQIPRFPVKKRSKNWS
ncbi:unnamed protein product [Amoebophrya sp. A120]|nr:unnamed protein product [Amoebophrya sp. A120]|eukprot:GSA120T00015106001.1